MKGDQLTLSRLRSFKVDTIKLVADQDPALGPRWALKSMPVRPAEESRRKSKKDLLRVSGHSQSHGLVLAVHEYSR